MQLSAATTSDDDERSEKIANATKVQLDAFHGVVEVK